MKIIKRAAACFLCGALLIHMLLISALAAGVTITLSADCGYAGDSITISGTCDPDIIITVKALDSSGNIVYLNPVLTQSDGTFSTTIIVPDVDAGTLTIIAGAGSDVASAALTVTVKANTGGGGSVVEDAADQSVSVTFDDTAKAYLNALAGSGDVVLDIETADITALSDEAQKLIGNRPVYSFSLTAGNTEVFEFGGGFAYISIPYTPATDEDFNKIVVYYISDNQELTVIPNALYDAESGTANFSTAHFSAYAVGYNDVRFDDVSQTAWYYDAVTFCAAREITTGTGNDLFSPDLTLTRGQFLVMLMRAYGIETDEDIKDNFDDAGDTYYTGYLAAAKSLGITNGVGNNLFSPEAEITRQDMFTLLYRALEVLDELPETDGLTSLSDFSDVDEISDYAIDATETFVGAGIVSGDDGGLDPLGGSTRAQMAQVLYKLLAM